MTRSVEEAIRTDRFHTTTSGSAGCDEDHAGRDAFWAASIIEHAHGVSRVRRRFIR